MSRRGIAVVVFVAALALAVAGIAGAARGSHARAGVNTTVSGTINFDGIWTSSSGAKQFADVIAAFNKKYPKVKVNYHPIGDNLPTVLSTAVAGGHPPDMADIAQPGFVKQLADQHKLKPITYAKGTIGKNYAPAWQTLGTFDGKLYALVFKAANKSLVWYNVPAFKAAGVKAPKTWAQLISAAKVLKSSGTPAYSIGGADGWTLTDLFENIYLRTYGPAKYAALSAHKIKWTDASVKKALKTMAAVVGDTSNIAGGTAGALQTDFPTSVSNVFSTSPKAAQVIEGDFVPGVVASSNKLKPVSGYNVFPFPTIGNTKNYVEGGGDELMMFRDTPATRALVQYLATGKAQSIWAKRGGYTAPAKTVPASAYPDAITRATATAVGKAKVFKFDLSDLQPASFGATVGQGEFKIFQDFLRNPKNVNGIASSLEKAAAKAYKSGK